MNEQIKAGDLVVVVRGCPHCGFRLGLVFFVEKIEMTGEGGFRCPACNSFGVYPKGLGACHLHGGKIPLSWLKKIEPPAILDKIERGEKIAA